MTDEILFLCIEYQDALRAERERKQSHSSSEGAALVASGPAGGPLDPLLHCSTGGVATKGRREA